MRRQIAEELAFDFRSYGGVGRVDRPRLSPAPAQLVARTPARTPEVMVKILSRRATSAKAVRRHLEYVGRKGEVELYTDDGDALKGRDAAGHVHVVFKARSEQGQRLNIGKSHLKEWRVKFA